MHFICARESAEEPSERGVVYHRRPAPAALSTPAMKTRHEHLDRLCEEIGERLKRLALQRCDGTISEGTFIARVLEIESSEVSPHDFTLTASNTLDDWTVFKLKVNGTNETCAAFEFRPETGQFRRVGSACDWEESHAQGTVTAYEAPPLAM
jgi:hypothetical protein